MKTKTIIILSAVILSAAFIVTRDRSPESAATEGTTLSAGEAQIVEITAKGGYRPEISAVKAGIPVILRFKTEGTYDCSSAVRIPKLGISAVLPPTGTKDIALGALEPGRLDGTCSMGMFSFSLDVKG